MQVNMNSNDKQGFWWWLDGIHKHGLGVFVGLSRPFITVEDLPWETTSRRRPLFSCTECGRMPEVQLYLKFIGWLMLPKGDVKRDDF